jgi:hypothetical protein
MSSRSIVFSWLVGCLVVSIGWGVPQAANAINVIGFAQKDARNTSGGPANDFHIDWRLPTNVLGLDVQTGTAYGDVTNDGTTDWDLAPPIANNGKMRVTYAPGGIPFIVDNLKGMYFTLDGNKIATDEAQIWEISALERLPTGDLFGTAAFVNAESAEMEVVNLAAYIIPALYFAIDSFALQAAIDAGRAVTSFPSSLLLQPGTSDFLDIGLMTYEEYFLITGEVVRSRNPDGTVKDGLHFAFGNGVPESSSFALIGLGLAALALVRTKRKAQKS